MFWHPMDFIMYLIILSQLDQGCQELATLKENVRIYSGFTQSNEHLFILSIYSGDILEQHMICKLLVDMHSSNPRNKQGLLLLVYSQHA